MSSRSLPTIILLEDNAIVALDLESLILETGLAKAVWASSIKEARELSASLPDAAVLLDVDINGCTSFELALHLQETGRRFAFLTGYGLFGDLPLSLKGTPMLGKPVSPSELTDLLRKLTRAVERD